MTFVLPTANNTHVVSPTANARHLIEIGVPSSTGAKTGGNLPISTNAGDWENTGTGTRRGQAFEFQASQAAWDVSGDTRVLVWSTQCNAPNRIQVETLANNGFTMRIYSGTGTPPTNYKDYQIGGNDTPMGSSVRGPMSIVIDLNDTSEETEVGTFDNTDVTSYAILTSRAAIAGGGSNWNYQQNLWVFTTTKGSADTPTFSGSGATFQDAVTLVQGTSYTTKIGNFVRQVGSVIFIDVGFRIGNNAPGTTFDDEGLTIISPVSDDASDPHNRLTTQACRVYLDLRNHVSDQATFSGTYFWGTRAPWDFDQDDAAVVTFSSPTFNGMGSFTIGLSITGPATWNDTGVVIFADAFVDVDGSTFNNPFEDHLIQLTASMDLANQTFQSYASADAAILIDTVGDYEFTDCVFDNSGVDIENPISGTLTDSYASSNQDGVTAVTDGSPAVGQSITGDGGVLSNAQFFIARVGALTGNAYAKLYAHSGVFGTSSVPTGDPLATSDPVDVAALSTSLTMVQFQFQDEFTLVNTTNYVIVFESDQGSGPVRMDIGHDASAPSHGGNLSRDTGSWAANSAQDLIFGVTTGAIVNLAIIGGSPPITSIRTGANPGAVIIKNNVLLQVTVVDVAEAAIENARVYIIATETAGTVTNGDVLLTGLTNASGVIEDVAFNFEAAFGAGLGIAIRIRQGTTSPFRRQREFTGTINASGYTVTAGMAADE